ncbi:MAG: DUF4342 domain-containing protein [Clostridium celatum]|nr:DUF4342 domain-containing protein [Clostridium celatum]
MENNEMIKKLMEKAHVTYEEAQEILERCNWDLLDAIIYLERSGKVENNDTTTIIEIKEDEQKKEDNTKKKQESYGGVGEIIGRIFKGLGKVIAKGNKNYFEIKKDNEKPIRISLTISILLLVFFMPPTVILLIIGLFCGYKYSIGGPNMNYHGVNDVFEKVSESADTIKKDFKKGYEGK